MGKFMRQARCVPAAASIPIPTSDGAARRRAARQVFYEIIRRAAPAARCQAICSVSFYRHRTMKASAITIANCMTNNDSLFAGARDDGERPSWTWLLLGQHPRGREMLVEELQRVLGGRAPTASALPRLT